MSKQIYAAISWLRGLSTRRNSFGLFSSCHHQKLNLLRTFTNKIEFYIDWVTELMSLEQKKRKNFDEKRSQVDSKIIRNNRPRYGLRLSRHTQKLSHVWLLLLLAVNLKEELCSIWRVAHICTMLNLIRRSLECKRHSFFLSDRLVSRVALGWKANAKISQGNFMKLCATQANPPLGPPGPSPGPLPPLLPPPRYSLVYLFPALLTFSPNKVLKLQYGQKVSTL